MHIILERSRMRFLKSSDILRLGNSTCLKTQCRASSNYSIARKQSAAMSRTSSVVILSQADNVLSDCSHAIASGAKYRHPMQSVRDMQYARMSRYETTMRYTCSNVGCGDCVRKLFFVMVIASEIATNSCRCFYSVNRDTNIDLVSRIRLNIVLILWNPSFK